MKRKKKQKKSANKQQQFSQFRINWIDLANREKKMHTEKKSLRWDDDDDDDDYKRNIKFEAYKKLINKLYDWKQLWI